MAEPGYEEQKWRGHWAFTMSAGVLDQLVIGGRLPLTTVAADAQRFSMLLGDRRRSPGRGMFAEFSLHRLLNRLEVRPRGTGTRYRTMEAGDLPAPLRQVAWRGLGVVA